MFSREDKIIRFVHSRLKISLAIVGFSILISVFITTVLMETFGEGIDQLTLSISVIAPAIIAPTVTWYIVGLLIRIHCLESEQRKLATYDLLTGVLRRRAFFEKLEVLFDLYSRKKTPLSLAYIDIDDFKKINDKYGHLAGDEVLTSFGDLLRNAIRASDLVGRLGGEEFVIAMPDTDDESALVVAEKVRLAVEQSNITFSDTPINYTISVGLSTCDDGNKVVMENLMHQADTALYKAKEFGKNRTVEFCITS